MFDLSFTVEDGMIAYEEPVKVGLYSDLVPMSLS